VNEPTAGLALLYLAIIAGGPAALAVLITIASRRGPLAAWVACGLGFLVFRLIGPVVFAPLMENDLDRWFFSWVFNGVGMAAVAATLVATGVRRRRPQMGTSLLAMFSAAAAVAVMIVVMIFTVARGAGSIAPS
jgi:hypothetical protein